VDLADCERYNRFLFPPIEQAGPEGIVAVGGNLDPQMLLSAYAQGIFPWYTEGQPILWWSPDPRFVLFPGRLHLPRSLKRTLNRGVFEVRFDEDFERVITECRDMPRPQQEGTWITAEMISAYLRLHDMGYAHSVEAYAGGALVGGLYGVSLGAAFFGESMFWRVAEASKVAFVALGRLLRDKGYHFIDCQIYTDHLARFGAQDVARAEFLRLLANALQQPTCIGNWGAVFAPSVST